MRSRSKKKSGGVKTCHQKWGTRPSVWIIWGSLAEYGLEYIQADPVSHVVFPDGTYITQWMDIERTCQEIAKFSRRDAQTYPKMMSEWRSVAPIFNKIRYTPPGWDASLPGLLAAHPQGAICFHRQALS